MSGLHLNFAGKTAVVTGSTRGVGWAIARTLAESGCRLIVNGLGPDTVSAAVMRLKEAGFQALGVDGDVALPSTADRGMETVAREFGGLDILVNCAAFGEWKGIENISLEDWSRVIDTNLKGTFLLCQRAIPLFKRQRQGRLVNISSVVGRSGRTRGAHYNASKGGIISMTQGLARELGIYNVTVNCVAPGFVETETSVRILTEAGIDLKFVKMSSALKRFVQPQDVANSVCFLCSDLAGAITGQTLLVDCGYLIA